MYQNLLQFPFNNTVKYILRCFQGVDMNILEGFALPFDQAKNKQTFVNLEYFGGSMSQIDSRFHYFATNKFVFYDHKKFLANQKNNITEE